MIQVRSRKTSTARMFSGKCDVPNCPCMATEEVFAFDGDRCLGAVGVSCTIDSPMLNSQHPAWIKIARREFGA